MGKLKDKIKHALGKGEHVAAKFAMWASRGAFMLATKLNIFKLAKRLKQSHDVDPEKTEKFWYLFGGEWKKLLPEIERGLKHMEERQKRRDKRHHKDQVGAITEDSTIGYYTIAAVIAAATPILTAVLKLFNKTKSDKPGDNEHDKNNLEILKKQIEAGGTKGVTIVATDKDGKEKVLDKGSNNLPLIIGGAAALAVGAYFIMKKKK
jgi:hypothetical protein